MGTCELRSACFFYSNLIKTRPRTLEYIKADFCESNYTGCARYMISRAHGSHKVPDYIFPDDIQEACKFLDELN